jgi:HSP20 family molecular chaperone IbpA
VVLPGELNSREAEATMKDRLLTLTIPKAAEAKPKAINVKAKEQPKEKK